jgi:hypothetical protein
VIKGNGGKFEVEISAGLAAYQGAENRGLNSKDYKATKLSAVYIQTEMEEFNPFTGMLVDYDLNNPDEGIITHVERTTTNGYYKIKVAVDRQ